MAAKKKTAVSLALMQQNAKAKRDSLLEEGEVPVERKGYARPDGNKKSRLEVWYGRMSDLTAPKCKSECNAPRTCCSAFYCEFTMVHARTRWGVELPRSRHPSLPLMGPNGCTAAPYLRPLCTAHVCEKHLQDPVFAERYNYTREQISKLEAQIPAKGSPEPSDSDERPTEPDTSAPQPSRTQTYSSQRSVSRPEL